MNVMKVFMSRNFCVQIFTLFLFLSVFLTVLLPSANAQSGAGIGIAPATIEEGVDPGQSKEYTVTVTNLSSTDRDLFIFPRDITGVRAGGAPIFAADNAEKTGFELSEWIELPIDKVFVEGNSSVQVTFKVNVPESASPGSHFGGLFFSAEPPRLRSSGAAVGYEVANIISLRVAGDAVEQAQIRSFSTDSFIYGSTDVTFNARIENQGNVLVRPVGPLEIHNMFGSEVAQFNFNDSLGGVFPGSIREFDVTWEDENPGFGRYEARLSLVYGSEGQKSTITSTVSFWILPMNIIGPALLVLLVILAITYFGVRAYVRRTLASYGGGRRLVTRRRQRRTLSTGLLIFVVMLSVTALFLIVLLLLFA